MSKRINISLKSFYHRVARHTILVFFHTERSGDIPTGTPHNEGVECRGGIKNRDFRPISSFISEIIQDRAIVTMECEQETVPNGMIIYDLE